MWISLITKYFDDAIEILLFLAVMFYKVTWKTELVITKPLLLGEMQGYALASFCS
jgi:hypothetical protein